MKQHYNPLFKKVSLPNGIELENPLVMAPMTTYSSNEDFTVSDEELEYYARRAEGIGMVVTAVAYVDASGRAFDGGFGNDSDKFLPSLKQLADTIKAKKAKAVLQIFHGGRQSQPHLTPDNVIYSASNIPVTGGRSQDIIPQPLTIDEIEHIVDQFGEATRRAIEAGFDGVEIHGANGYLIQQFFSPHANRRTDHYGGTLNKRLNFPLAVIASVKQAVERYADRPFIVGYRFSPEEPETPGITMDQTLTLVDVLADQPLDYLHVSLGHFASEPRRGVQGPDLTKTRLQLIHEQTAGRLPVIGVGSINTPEDALQALESGVELIALGRQLIVDPDWVKKVKSGKENDIKLSLRNKDRKAVTVPVSMWQRLRSAPGWLPFED